MRELSDLERCNVELLARLDVPFGLLEQTSTTLAKAYSDATQEFREFLRAVGIHDYTKQDQGQQAKVYSCATIIEQDRCIQSEMALYRPLTKRGDPRVRISHIKNICCPGDIAAVLYVNGGLFVVRLDQSDLEAELARRGPIRDILGSIARRRFSAAEELLEMILAVAERGYIQTHRTGDTAVGHLLET
jgi:hypothetical protein